MKKEPLGITRFIRVHWFSILMALIWLFGFSFYVVMAAAYPDVLYAESFSYVIGHVFIALFTLTVLTVIYYVERQHRIRKKLTETADALRGSEERLRGVFEHSRDLLFALDEGGAVTLVSPNAMEITGLPREEIVGRHYAEMLSGESRPEALYRFARARDGEVESESFEVEIIAAGGRVLPALVSATALRDGGRFVGLMGMMRDLSETLRAEAELLRYTRALTALMEIGRSIAQSFNIDDVLKEVLGSAVEMTGLDSGAIYVAGGNEADMSMQVHQGLGPGCVSALGEVTPWEVRPGGEQAPLVGASHLPERARAALLEEGIEFLCTVPLVTRSSLVGAMVVSGHGPHVLEEKDVHVLDNIALKLAVALENSSLLRQLVASRTQLEATLESVDDPVVVLDVDRRITYANSRLEKVFGLDRRDLAGKDLGETLFENRELVYGRDLAAVEIDALLDARLEGADTPFEASLGTTSGMRDFEVAITGIEIEGRAEGLVCIMHDVTGFKRLDQLKSDFVAAASHQLRTPLASIVGFAETILHHFSRIDDAEKREYLQIVVKHARKLAGVVNDLLDFSKLEKGELALERESVYIPEIAASVIGDFKESSPDHAFILEFEDGFPTVEADYFKVEHVLNNLVANAVKFSPDGGDVRIGGRRKGGFVEVWVSDRGVGVSVDEMDKLFRRFYHAPPSRIINKAGTGLGLYIVKMLVDAHGGEVSVGCEPAGGARFSFTLPA